MKFCFVLRFISKLFSTWIWLINNVDHLEHLFSIQRNDGALMMKIFLCSQPWADFLTWQVFRETRRFHSPRRCTNSQFTSLWLSDSIEGQRIISQSFTYATRMPTLGWHLSGEGTWLESFFRTLVSLDNRREWTVHLKWRENSRPCMISQSTISQVTLIITVWRVSLIIDHVKHIWFFSLTSELFSWLHLWITSFLTDEFRNLTS